jgi:5-methylcytosine-specific restriction endonuclease McrA
MIEVKRKMPSRDKIFNYWIDKINDLRECGTTICWACGFAGGVERCHIHDRCKSENDNLDNLVLLCKHCHKIQETMCTTQEGRSIFISKLIEGNFLFVVRYKQLEAIYNSGIYNHLLKFDNTK